MKRTLGFTLIELLVVISIIGLLTAILLPALGAARRSALQVQELAAVRSTLQAYATDYTDNRGRLLPARDRSRTLTTPDGTVISAEAAERYTWRLAERMGDQFAGSLFVGDAEKLLGGSGASWAYTASLYPSIAYNGFFVGERIQSASTTPTYAVTRIAQVADPTRMFAFVSAADVWVTGGPFSDTVPGRFEVVPTLTVKEDNTPPPNGYVDPRWSGKASTGFFDGHAAATPADDFNDIRIWANPAARANDPTWRP